MAEKTVEQLFKKLVGRSEAKLYPYQERASEEILNGGNIIICAPTGAGKTWAALLPYLYSKKTGRAIADRIIYALPMRTLATSLYESTVESCHRGGWRVVTDPFSPVGAGDEGQDEIRITIQTGERKEDPFFLGEIVFTTIDQLLSGYLNIPVSLPDKLANINAGALVGSLVVMDEIHLLEPERSLGTVMEMCGRLNGFSQFVLMTATLSNKAISLLRDELKAVVERVEEKELQLIPSQKDKDKSYVWVDKPLGAESVLKFHGGGRSIVICNSVARSQEIYRSVKEEIGRRGLNTRLFLLHSRFFKRDRNRVERELPYYFGPHARHNDVILVATQAVEAGVDISAENLHTELAPANSLVQRAGRCARYGGERGRGSVWIYELPVDDRGRPRMGPYRDQAEIVSLTRLEVAGPPVKMDFIKEQSLVDEVMEKSEIESIGRVISGLGGRHHKVNSVVEQAVSPGARSYAAELIRDADSVSVLISDQPENVDLYKPREYLPLPRVALWSLQAVFDSQTGPWVAKIPIGASGEEETGFTWIRVDSVRDLIAAGWIICLHPNAVSYTEELGLETGRAGGPVDHPSSRIPVVFRPKYRCESFRNHSMAVVKEGRSLQARHRVGLARMSSFLRCAPEALGKIIDVTLALHDVGKLSVKWQKGIRNRQGLVDPSHPLYLRGEPLAHSTFDWEEHRHLVDELRKPGYDRGNHSVEGSFCLAEGMYTLVGNLVGSRETEQISAACWTAIARHHHAGAVSLSDFSLVSGAWQYVAGILNQLGLDAMPLKDRPDKENIRFFVEDYLLKPSRGGVKHLPLYWMVVRLLRLADQASQRVTAD